MRTATQLLLALALPAVAVAGMAWAEEEGAAAAGTLTPAHVFQRVSVIHAELELIRLEMGKPAGKPSLLKVDNAAPREVYFQALTFFRKANRLSFERASGKVGDPVTPTGTIRPGHVYELLGRAWERLKVVKERLGITEESQEPPLAEGVKPTQVFSAIVDANRSINGLLDQRFAPGDVFREVTVAIVYTSRLLEATGGIAAPPDAPAFESRKRPVDVYQRLLECFKKIRRVAKISNVQVLTIANSDKDYEETEPSDVYDLASLLVSEVAYFHGLLPEAGPPRETYNPGRKLPSHVYQRSGILLQQLDMLIERTEQNPEWLGKQNGPLPAQP